MIDGRALSLTAVLAILLSLPSCSDNRTRAKTLQSRSRIKSATPLLRLQRSLAG